MNKRKKVAICILLSTGVSAFGFAVIKIVELKNDANHSDITCKYEINLIIIAACIPTLIPLLEIILNHRIASYLNSYKTNRGDSKFSFHKESFRMRRLNSANNDTESGKDILGIKNSINGNSRELRVVEESEETPGNENTDRIMSQGKIAVTRQWSVTELKY
ncbi:hypothetical protein BELL_0915g00010 [Botrytis elliptica]|uniref:Integral membrane protein n=1 Tax=Botrytis elliptica TaxID=278938 RepID=A0A4Z1J1P3_9HELO|nr:hypothetical protein BELL_0915g00010 [Botrytis elliptica]